MLYPLKFNSILKEKIWGGSKLKTFIENKIITSENIGESWEISGVTGDLTSVKNGILKGKNINEIIAIYNENLLGKKIFNRFKNNFPLLIKFIDANKILSLQVHPNDKIAKEKYNSFGKSEIWYIIDSEKDSEIITGFKKETDKIEFENRFHSGNLNEILNFEKTAKGDVFYIPAGRVHTIGAGNLIAEIQQSSDITFRISDWDRVDETGKKRELHYNEAIEATDFSFKGNLKCNYTEIEKNRFNLLESDFFSVNFINITETIILDYSQIDSFIIYICLKGSFEILYSNTEKVSVQKGETVLIPACLKKIILEKISDSQILEVYI